MEESQSLAPPKPTGLRQKGHTLGSSPASSSRSFDQAGLNRSDSYERGDEQRAFIPGSQGSRVVTGVSHNDEGEHSAPPSEASQSELEYQKRRNFSPSVLPQPLYAKGAPPTTTTEEATKKFPARKSSLVADEVPIEQASRSNRNPETLKLNEHDQSPVAGGAHFIRPADIYKRMEAEREKERMSLDSQRSGSDKSPKSVVAGDGSSRLRTESPGKACGPASTIGNYAPESKAAPSYISEADRGGGPTSAPAVSLNDVGDSSRLMATTLNHESTASSIMQPSNRSSFLPQVHRISGFGDDLWSSADNDSQTDNPKADLRSAEDIAPEPKDADATEESSSQASKPSMGYKAIVQQAFDRPDRSALRTPLSAQESMESQNISRSNTDSTAGISPILSRMPSGAAGAKTRAKEAELRAIATPSIDEESHKAQKSTYLPNLASSQRIPRKPASRSASGEYDPRQRSGNRNSEVKSQSLHRIVADLPRVEQRDNIQHSAEAEMDRASLGPSSPINSDDGAFKAAMLGSKAPLSVDTEQSNRNSRIAARISNLSANASKSPEATVPRAESPTKGRVRDLAGKFNDGSSKRDSSPSPSRSSMISLGKTKNDFSMAPPGQRNSMIGDMSTRQSDLDRPTAQREASFRPYIPGRWESYSTTAGTPAPNEQDGKKADIFFNDSDRSRKAADPSPLARMEEDKEHDSNSVDLTPRKTDGRSAVDKNAGPDPLHMASLSQAGQAMGEALKASVGLGGTKKDNIVMDNKEPSMDSTSSERGAPIGQASQPVGLMRTDSPASSRSAPSPPAKDELAASQDNSDYFRAPEPLSVAGARRSKQTQSKILRRTEESSLSDQDSDRLREEIEQTLSPTKSSEEMIEDKSGSKQLSSQTSPMGNLVNRESSVIPSEYDSYWASTDDHNTQQQSVSSPLGPITESSSNITGKDKELDTPVSSAIHELPSYTLTDTKPKLSTRFSWETDKSTPTKAGAAKDRSEIDVDTPSKPVVTQVTPQAQTVESSPQPPVKDNAEDISRGGIDNSENEVQPQIASLGKGSDPQIQPLSSSSIGKDVTPEVPPKADLAAKPVPELPSPFDGKAADVSESTSTPFSETSTAYITPTQKTSSHRHHENSPPSQSGAAFRQYNNAWRPPPFREILAIKSPNERIQTYDRYRAQLVNTDSGLSQWIKATISKLPEHGKMVNNPYGQPLSVSTSFPTSLHQHGDKGASRFQGVSATAGPASAHPIVHHNQHASPQSAGGVGGAAGGGARLSSQQVQAKGKDLLHSAGVFGGKASTISKGLFAKGRSRLKGGTSEKVDN